MFLASKDIAGMRETSPFPVVTPCHERSSIYGIYDKLFKSLLLFQTFFGGDERKRTGWENGQVCALSRLGESIASDERGEVDEQ